MNNLLGQVPGVNVYQEDGFGLRPNISLRGTSPERSSKITIMEDGVLMANLMLHQLPIIFQYCPYAKRRNSQRK